MDTQVQGYQGEQGPRKHSRGTAVQNLKGIMKGLL